MERLTCYESILYQLLVFNYATKKSLLLLNFSKDAIYRAVERGLEERTISDGRMTYNIKGVSRKHQLTYLTITTIGIEYLKQKCSHKIQSQRRGLRKSANQRHALFNELRGTVPSVNSVNADGGGSWHQREDDVYSQERGGNGEECFSLQTEDEHRRAIQPLVARRHREHSWGRWCGQ